MNNNILFDSRSILRSIAFTLALNLMCLSHLTGEEKSIALRVQCQGGFARSGAPIQLELKFKYTRSTPLSGKVELIFRDGGCILSRCRTDQLILTGRRPSFRITVPPLEIMGLSPEGSSPVYIDKIFVSEEGRIDLGYDLLITGGQSDRSLIICVPKSGSSNRESPYRRIIERLRLERYGGQPKQKSNSARAVPSIPVSTRSAFVVPGSLPETPYGFCSYDLLVLAGTGFAELRPAQLAALLHWVKAGGSVLAIPDLGLKQYHLRFLNQLIDSESSPRLSLSSFGRVTSMTQQESIFSCHNGLGRSMIILSLPKAESQQEELLCRRMTGFLWRIRNERRGILQQQEYVPTQMNLRSYRYYYPDLRSQYRSPGRSGDVHHRPLPIGESMLRGMLPAKMSLIPIWIILTVLVLLVLLIGPIDYILLGRLRQRKLTWVTFPGICVFTALLMMQLSNYYMAGTGGCRSLTIRDLDSSDRIVRESSYEVLFAGSNLAVRHSPEQSSIIPMDRKDFSSGYGSQSRSSEDMDISPPWYEGRFPNIYSMEQSIRQWDPQLNRSFTLNPSVKKAEVVLRNIDPALFTTSAGRKKLAEHFRSISHPQNCIPLLLHKEKVYSISEQKEWNIGHIASQSLPRGYRYPRNHDTTFEPALPGFPISIFCAISARPKMELFNLVSQVSPHGGANFEDLSLLDSSDPGQWLLIVLTRKGQDHIMYRRLFVTHAGTSNEESGMLQDEEIGIDPVKALFKPSGGE